MISSNGFSRSCSGTGRGGAAFAAGPHELKLGPRPDGALGEHGLDDERGGRGRQPGELSAGGEVEAVLLQADGGDGIGAAADEGSEKLFQAWVDSSQTPRRVTSLPRRTRAPWADR
jgi:hypothetical protein